MMIWSTHGDLLAWAVFIDYKAYGKQLWICILVVRIINNSIHLYSLLFQYRIISWNTLHVTFDDDEYMY